MMVMMMGLNPVTTTNGSSISTTATELGLELLKKRRGWVFSLGEGVSEHSPGVAVAAVVASGGIGAWSSLSFF